LTDGSQCLQLRKMFWSLLNIHALQSNANGARGYNDDPVAILS
jgi:hypothetical protein